MPFRVICSGVSPAMSSPWNSTEPRVGDSSPVIRLIVVVFPAPFGPIRP
jgi:hypothetical protein